ncbi:MAG: hypothetical protein ACLU9V_04410 [Roseburia sp.]
MSVTYQPRETDDNAVIFVVGSTPKDLSGAQITIGNTTYNGTAKSVTAAVECDGKTLVEGRDYLVTGGFEITRYRYLYINDHRVQVLIPERRLQHIR